MYTVDSAIKKTVALVSKRMALETRDARGVAGSRPIRKRSCKDPCTGLTMSYSLRIERDFG